MKRTTHCHLSHDPAGIRLSHDSHAESGRNFISLGHDPGVTESRLDLSRGKLGFASTAVYPLCAKDDQIRERLRGNGACANYHHRGRPGTDPWRIRYLTGPRLCSRVLCNSGIGF